jgi:ubiquinone biosynthesis protein
VLTLERLRGIRIDDRAGLDRAGVDPGALAINASSVLLEMALDDGFFHADPHPGNFMVEPDGCIGLIDFGMVGHLDDQLREKLVRFAIAVSRRNADLATSALLSICGASWTPDREALTAALANLLARYPQPRLGDMPTSRIVLELAGLLRTHRLHLPLQLSLLLKTVMMADGLGRRLDPDFDLLGMLKPFVHRMVLRSMGPSAMLRRLTNVVQEAVELGLDAPDIIRRTVAVLERGGFDVHLRTAELEPLVARAERIGNRLVAGAIISAFISGIGKIVAGDRARFGSWERPMIVAGFGSLGALGGYLATTARHRRLNRL